MEVIIAPCDSLWDHEVCVPVKKHFGCEILVIVSEQVSDVPVTMVIPLDALVQRIVCFELQCLGTKLMLVSYFEIARTCSLSDRTRVLIWSLGHIIGHNQ